MRLNGLNKAREGLESEQDDEVNNLSAWEEKWRKVSQRLRYALRAPPDSLSSSVLGSNTEKPVLHSPYEQLIV